MKKKLSPLRIALIVSLLLHAALLTMRFTNPQAFNRIFQDTPLEVILVNEHTDEKPKNAKAIAQANTDGGGDADKGRPSSPLPNSALMSIGDSYEQTQQTLEKMRQEQTNLLAQLRKQIASMPVPEPKELAQNEQVQEREQKRQQLMKILAEIEKQMKIEAEKPKKRYISPSTREEVYAIYYDHLRQKIEERGTQQFPQVQGRKLYGELTMSLTVNFDGGVLDTEIVESSGNNALDKRAEAIARAAGPFGEFIPAMRKKADQIVILSRFKFTKNEELQTQLLSNDAQSNP